MNRQIFNFLKFNTFLNFRKNSKHLRMNFFIFTLLIFRKFEIEFEICFENSFVLTIMFLICCKVIENILNFFLFFLFACLWKTTTFIMFMFKSESSSKTFSNFENDENNVKRLNLIKRRENDFKMILKFWCLTILATRRSARNFFEILNLFFFVSVKENNFKIDINDQETSNIIIFFCDFFFHSSLSRSIVKTFVSKQKTFLDVAEFCIFEN